ncbi:hypothetical protein TeGR_g11578 [Tetraparma gracilis]|uniref:Kinesin motor domain-containing protein n=1 Tax=Tetraparma gracilis TaxID=2962635 RepID=A0ABQ6MVX0_9STRA|nr:hypothetical protein TeGR_g11578 [Tetraparma gracilis]
MNDTSSRSHAVVRLTTTHSDKSTSVLTIVDLAGSEKQTSTGATGERLKEAASINNSLSTLAGVIYALGVNSTNPAAAPRHVPFRDSKLTMLLRGSLSPADCRTAMVCTVAPHGDNFAETL